MNTWPCSPSGPMSGARMPSTTWSPAAISSIASTWGSCSLADRAFSTTSAPFRQISSGSTPRWTVSGVIRFARRSMSPRRIASTQSAQMISMLVSGSRSATHRWSQTRPHATTGSDPLVASGLLTRVERDGLADERLQRRLVDLLILGDVDRAARLALQARVEQALGIIQRRALHERQLDDALVGLAGADDAVARPDRCARTGGLGPRPLLDDLRVGGRDDPPHPAQRLAAPIAELLDALVDLRRRVCVVVCHSNSPSVVTADGRRS